MIHAEKATHDVSRMVELLEVSRSGYYAWADRQARGELGPRAARRADLLVKIKVAHDASDGVNGAPRILADLREAGEVVSRKTVAKLMRGSDIRGISPRPWRPVTTIADASAHAIPDLVQRRFDRGALNAVWTSDITYLPTGQGWLYLCAVRDGCSRRVLGYAFADNLHTDLVESALRRAVTFREAATGATDKVIFHADRGCQYTCDPAGRRRRRARRAALGRTHRGVLGQRPAGELLVDPEDRVLPAAPLRHPPGGHHGRQLLDRERLQPPATAQRARPDQPSSV